jgi:hypothetical protein
MTSEAIGRDRLEGTHMTRTHARRDHARGLPLLESARYLQQEVVECVRLCAQVGMRSRVRGLIGSQDSWLILMISTLTQRSPPPRRYSPARDNREYRRRSPSPRRDRLDAFTADTWRRRSPSPAKPTYASNDASGRDSAATSRRSSPPPIHPSRAALVDDSRAGREAGSAPRSPFRERDADRGRDFNRERERSPPRRRDSPPTGPRGDREFAPPTGPSSSSYRNGDSNFSRAPPTGPSSRSYPSPAISPPAGPAGSTPQPPAYPRGPSNPALAAPTRPRGGGRGGFGYESRGDFSGPRRGSWSGGPRGGGGGFYGGGAPSGPRGSNSGPAPFAPPFRGSSNSTATTYPRTMRFRDHLSDLPKEIPGGQKAPEVYDKSRLLKLEEDARRLREMIDKKEDEKRMKLREWDGLERDAGTAQLKVDLAEASLRELEGEGDMSSAF